MKPKSECPVVVLGAGPAGIIAALKLSKAFETTLVWRPTPSTHSCFRVDAVPAALLALLVEFGVRPGELGIDTLHRSQLRAWVCSAIEENPIPASAHVERPLLEEVLLSRLRELSAVRIRAFHPDLFDQWKREEQRGRVHLLDATGRRSMTSERIVRPTRPWVARSFVTRSQINADLGMRIASMPHGYVYRMGSSQHLVLVAVGRPNLVNGTPVEIERYIIDHGAGWILEGLPSLSQMMSGIASTASLQWSAGGIGFRIGDAAIGRDAISGQGLALGITDAMCAASSLIEDGCFRLLDQRQSEQRDAHIRSLMDAVRNSRFRQEVTWREYSEFLDRNSPQGRSATRIALRLGRMRVLEV